MQTLRRSVGGSDFKGETSEGGGRCDILTKEGLSLEGDWDYVAQHLTSGRMPKFSTLEIISLASPSVIITAAESRA